MIRKILSPALKQTGTRISTKPYSRRSGYSVREARRFNFFFLTDGLPTEGVVSPYTIRQNLEDANIVDVSIFSVAFGINDESNYHFLKVMSLENYGTAEWFAPDNGSDKIDSFYEMISTPLISDMDFSYSEGTSEIVSTGKKNLFAGSDAIILGKYNLETKNIFAEISATTRTETKFSQKKFP